MHLSRLAPFALAAVSLLAPRFLAAEPSASAQADKTRLFTAEPSPEAFVAPPHEFGIDRRWIWKDGNANREGITTDLENIARMGIFKLQYFSTGAEGGPGAALVPEPPDGGAQPTGDRWRELFRHAVDECDRLGIKLITQNCPGFSHSGGPWTTVENAMQMLTSSRVSVSGPGVKTLRLSQPPTDRSGFYRDIAVVAYPVPAGAAARVSAHLAEARCNDQPADLSALWDDNPATAPRLAGDGKTTRLDLRLDRPLDLASFSLRLGGRNAKAVEGVLWAARPGGDFERVRDFVQETVNVKTTGGLDPALLHFAVSLRGVDRLRLEFAAAPKQLLLEQLDFSGQALVEDAFSKAAYAFKYELGISPDDRADPARSVPAAGVVDLSSAMSADGSLKWDFPPGDWIVLRLGHTPTGAINHHARDLGLGYECDKMSRAAVKAHFEAVMHDLVGAAGPAAPRVIEHFLFDSYEAGNLNWTPLLRDEFKRRRGYDLLPWFPALVGQVVESPQATDRFLWDFRRTISDLVVDNFFGQFTELANAAGYRVLAQPYGNGYASERQPRLSQSWLGEPFDVLQSGGRANAVEGETWGNVSDHARVDGVPSSANVYGIHTISNEAHPSRERLYSHDPSILKPGDDAIFCAGFNHLSYQYGNLQAYPWLKPGINDGARPTYFCAGNTWFAQTHAYVRYLDRCQYLLQHGRPVIDVLYFSGEGVPNRLNTRDLDLHPGYQRDACPAEIIEKHTRFADGLYRLDGGMTYRLLVLPPDNRIRPELLEKIRDLVRAGGTLLGAKPVGSPSLSGGPDADRRVAALADELWGSGAPAATGDRAVGPGRVLWGVSVDQALEKLGVAPDLDVVLAGKPQSKERPTVRFYHRATPARDLYFVASRDGKPSEADLTFRVAPDRVPSLWNPETGEVLPASVWQRVPGGVRVTHRFDPQQSLFFVFEKKPTAPAAVDFKTPAPGDAPAATLRSTPAGLVLAAFQSGAHVVRLASGAERALQPSTPAPLAVPGPWKVSFEPNRGAPAEVAFPELVDWTLHSDPGVKYFSGAAVYHTTLDVPADRLGAGRLHVLDLGRLANLAEVRLNGRDLGVLWKTPFRVDVSGALRPGANELEIKIVNLWVNRFIGDELLPDDCEWFPQPIQGDLMLKKWPDWALNKQPRASGRVAFSTSKEYRRDDKLLPSGLLGPVRLWTGELLPVAP